MVHAALGTGKHRVVVGHQHATRAGLVELVAVDVAKAHHQSVGRGVVEQLVQGAVQALADGEGAVLHEGAFVRQVVDVLPRTASTLRMAFGDLFPARRVGGQGAPTDDFGEIRARCIQVEFEVLPGRLALHRAFLDDQEHGLFRHGIAFRDVELCDRPADRRLDDVLHLHGVHDQQFVLGQDRVARGDRERDNGGLHGRAHRPKSFGVLRLLDHLGPFLLPDLAALAKHGERIRGIDLGTGQRHLGRRSRLVGEFSFTQKPWQMIVDVARVHRPGPYFRVIHHVHQHAQVRVHPADDELAKRASRPVHGIAEIRLAAVHDEFGEQRVVEAARPVALVGEGVDADARPFGWAKRVQGAGAG